MLEALEQARLEYESAKQKYTRLKIYTSELGEAHPDAAFAFRQAIREFNTASRHYSYTLTAFTRFILRRKPFA
jgi:hypothetical protein